MQTLQFEVFRRQKDMWYEFKDLARCVQEWQKKNPRTMIREDPREEVLKIRIRNIMDLCSAEMTARRSHSNRQRRAGHILFGVQLSSAVMTMLMLFTAYYRYRNTPSQILISWMLGSQQFLSSISFLLSFAVAYIVGQRHHTDSMEGRLQRLIYSCERLREQISDFRVETEHMRLARVLAPKAEALQAGGAPRPKKMPKAPKGPKQRKKKPKDDGLAMWAPDYNKGDPAENLLLLKKAIDDSYKFLPPLPDSFRRPGGDRMVAHASRLGGIDEDELVVASKGRGGTKFENMPLLPALPELAGATLHPDDLQSLPGLTHDLPALPMRAPMVPLLPPPPAVAPAAAQLPPPTPPGAVGRPNTPTNYAPLEPDDAAQSQPRHLHHWMPSYVGSEDEMDPEAHGSQTPPPTPPQGGQGEGPL